MMHDKLYNYFKVDLMANRRFFCKNSSAIEDPLPKDLHPALELQKPVRHLHIEVKDKGEFGKFDEGGTILYDADFGRRKILERVDTDALSEGGFRENFVPICPKVGKPRLIEIKVTADDVETSLGQWQPSSPRANRDIDQIRQFKVSWEPSDKVTKARPEESEPRSDPEVEAAELEAEELVREAEGGVGGAVDVATGAVMQATMPGSLGAMACFADSWIQCLQLRSLRAATAHHAVRGKAVAPARRADFL
eukprot:TRINITY_DN36643_c0_g1_i1.p1 TRINITY_DN36643_c0_g1~~TRINITY_DN36643_c0_g1_i1.p1  ORF type:complete len:250 (-),score=68.08 TRINITY_DN36643_c0_g1_i1:76-825(-)